MISSSGLGYPNRIPNCLLWLDGMDFASITQSAGPVSQWNDKSGNFWNAAASGTARPTYSATGLNGRPTMTYNGTSNYFTCSCKIPDNVTTFAVATRNTQTTGGSALRAIVMVATTNSTGPTPLFCPKQDTVPPDAFGATWLSAGTGTSGAGSFTTTPKILTSTLELGTTIGSGWLSGASVFSSAITAGTANASQIGDSTHIGGQNFNLTRCFAGTISEVIMYNRLLSAAERRRVEWYLARKWAIPVV